MGYFLFSFRCNGWAISFSPSGAMGGLFPSLLQVQWVGYFLLSIRCNGWAISFSPVGAVGGIISLLCVQQVGLFPLFFFSFFFLSLFLPTVYTFYCCCYFVNACLLCFISFQNEYHFGHSNLHINLCTAHFAQSVKRTSFLP